MNEYERKREEMPSELSHRRLLINHRVVRITEPPELILLIFTTHHWTRPDQTRIE